MSQKKEEADHFQYYYKFYDQITYAEFQAATTIMPQGNFTSNCDIEQHITMNR
jgi:hypothetical protein